MAPELPALGAFFLSGTAALIFEVAWFHRAGLAFGNSLWAVTVVLSAFMGGLAIGNALVARYASRIRRPIACYAALETRDQRVLDDGHGSPRPAVHEVLRLLADAAATGRSGARLSFVTASA